MDLKAKSVVITGAARGLGKLYAEEFLKRGAKVCIADILKDEGEDTEQQFKKKYGEGNVFFVHADLTRKENVIALFDAVTSRFGQIDVVINNAGTINPDLCIDINLKALMWGTEIAIERMDKTKGGKGGTIINISSMAGIEIHPVIGPYYTSSKFGAVAASRCLFVRLEDGAGIRINTLCPSYIQTDLTKPIEEVPKDHPIWTSIEATGGWLTQQRCCDALMKLVTDENLKNDILRIGPNEAHLVEIQNKLTPIEI